MTFLSSLCSNTPRLIALFLVAGLCLGSSPAPAQQRAALDRDVHAAIQLLLEKSPAAKKLAPSARGALVFTNIVKAGFLRRKRLSLLNIVSARFNVAAAYRRILAPETAPAF